MKRPCLLTLAELLTPVKRAHDKVDAITRAHVNIAQLAQSTADKTLSGIANEGLFVLLVSRFEVMLSDVLMSYLQEFPEKMEFKDSPFTTDQVVGATLAKELWEIKAESLVRTKMYQDVSTVMKYFLATLSINDCPLDQDQVDKLGELKQTRNLLLHADLIANTLYLEKAGLAARATRPGQKLSIDDTYLGDCLVTIKFFLVEIERRLTAKYASYTRLAALERLWNYMIANPKITPFDDYWYIDVSNDVIRPRRNHEAEQRMGSSERLFLALWRDSFNGATLSYSDERLSLTCLDPTSTAQLSVFLSAAKRMGVIAN
jgi:hypothetical protein